MDDYEKIEKDLQKQYEVSSTATYVCCVSYSPWTQGTLCVCVYWPTLCVSVHRHMWRSTKIYTFWSSSCQS